MLVLTIAEDFDKLFENGCLTAIAALGELCGIVIMAVYVAFVFVVTVLGAEDSRTHGAGKMLDVVFAIQGGNVRAAQSASAGMAEQVQSAEIIRFAKGVLIRGLLGDREEFRSDDFTAVLDRVSNGSMLHVLTDGRGR